MSEIRATTISDAAGTGPITLTGQSAAKVYSNIFGGGTVSIRQSLNLSSLADNGTGNYTLTFTNAFDFAEYDTQVTGDANDAQTGCASVTETNTVSAIRTRYYNTGGVVTDCIYGGTTIHGDLA